MYKKIKSKAGFRYIKDGRLVAKKDIPEDELIKLEGLPESPTTDKNCLFCEVAATHARTVNLQMVALCERHYYSENIGSIAAKLKE